MNKPRDFGEITKTLRSEIISGATPSQAGKTVFKKYGLISVVDMIHVFSRRFSCSRYSYYGYDFCVGTL